MAAASGTRSNTRARRARRSTRSGSSSSEAGEQSRRRPAARSSRPLSGSTRSSPSSGRASASTVTSRARRSASRRTARVAGSGGPPGGPPRTAATSMCRSPTTTRQLPKRSEVAYTAPLEAVGEPAGQRLRPPVDDDVDVAHAAAEELVAQAAADEPAGLAGPERRQRRPGDLVGRRQRGGVRGRSRASGRGGLAAVAARHPRRHVAGDLVVDGAEHAAPSPRRGCAASRGRPDADPSGAVQATAEPPATPSPAAPNSTTSSPASPQSSGSLHGHLVHADPCRRCGSAVPRRAPRRGCRARGARRRRSRSGTMPMRVELHRRTKRAPVADGVAGDGLAHAGDVRDELHRRPQAVLEGVVVGRRQPVHGDAGAHHVEVGARLAQRRRAVRRVADEAGVLLLELRRPAWRTAPSCFSKKLVSASSAVAKWLIRPERTPPASRLLAERRGPRARARRAGPCPCRT